MQVCVAPFSRRKRATSHGKLRASIPRSARQPEGCVRWRVGATKKRLVTEGGVSRLARQPFFLQWRRALPRGFGGGIIRTCRRVAVQQRAHISCPPPHLIAPHPLPPPRQTRPLFSFPPYSSSPRSASPRAPHLAALGPDALHVPSLRLRRSRWRR